MSKVYKFNQEFAFSLGEEGRVNIINLVDDENMYILTKVAAEIFPKLVAGESLKELAQFIESMENSPSRSEIGDFLESFTGDLLKLNIIKEVE